MARPEMRWRHFQRHFRPMRIDGVVAVSTVAAGGEIVALAAKAATSIIPVAFIVGTDPVKAGLVASLSRPGGNVTGVTLLTATLGAKRLGLVRDIVPAATLIAVLVNPLNSNTAAYLSSNIMLVRDVDYPGLRRGRPGQESSGRLTCRFFPRRVGVGDDANPCALSHLIPVP
jgi:hypothetical protein